jgi:heavy metal translocating P-type ATPase
MFYNAKPSQTVEAPSTAAPSIWKFWSRRAERNTTPAPLPDQPAQPALKASMGTITTNDGQYVSRVRFEVKHWVKGRLRINIPRLSVDEEYRERLQYEIRATGAGYTIRVNPKAGSLLVQYDPATHEGSAVLEQVIACIKAAGQPGVVLDHSETEEPGESTFKINYGKRLGLPALAASMLGAGAFLGLALPPLLLGGTIIAASIPSYRRAWEAIRDERKLNVDFLDSTAITLLTATGFFFPPVLMVTLIESGEIIRDLTARRSARANLDLLDSLGKFARVERDGGEVEVPLDQVVVGDIVVVYPGDQIPVDGVVLSGIGLVDQQKLTGESVPVTREEGHDVFAATLVVDGTMRIETRRTGDNTRAGIVVSLMKSAPVHDTRMEDYARKVGDRIVVPTLALGTATTALSGSIVRGAGVITFDVGTGVRVSVPTAILASLTFAARNGILMRSGRGLEQMASVDTVVFDKTGTLTQGKAGVVGIYTETSGISPLEVLQLAATAEQGLTHPVAEAITRHARETEVPLKECEEWEFQVGKGVAATIDGRRIYVGSHRMMTGLNIDIQHMLDAHPDIVASAASQVYVATDGALLGVILYKDPARPESIEVIRKLHEMGITPYMLSGDMQNVATAVAAELGIAPEHVFAEAFPERKVEVVKRLQEEGKIIAFVGDGINDSAALAHATCSVSFAGATDMARETADIVLMDDDLASLILAIQISKHAMSVVNQNAAIVVGPNLGGMLWAAFVGINPTIAVLINNGSAIAAEVNGFRPLMGPPGWKQLRAQQDAVKELARQARAMALGAASPTSAQETNGSGLSPAISKAAVPDIVIMPGNGTNGNGHSAKAGNGTNGNGNGKNGHVAGGVDYGAPVVAGPVTLEHGNGANGHHGSNGNGKD